MRTNRYLAISYRVEKSSEVKIEERLGVEALAAVIMNFDSDCIEEYEYWSPNYNRRLDISLQHSTT